jgi:dTDP-4-dehydrorhamnose reductase
MKLLVTGGSGLLGSHIVKRAKRKYSVISAYWRHFPEGDGFKTAVFNIKNFSDVVESIEKYLPDVIIHSAALTNVDYCEKNRKEAWMTNAKGTQNVVKACEKIGAKMVYISTAGIFDGKRAPYTEVAQPNPLNYYARTKLQGERYTRMLEGHLIVRTTVPYGWHPWKLNFVTWVIGNLKRKIPIKIVTDQRNTPTYADDFAKALLRLIKLDKKGIFNIAGATSISRFDFVMKIVKIFNLNKNLVLPVTSKELAQVAQRPRDDSLKINKILKLGIKMSSVDEGLRKMRREKSERGFISRRVRN